MHCSVYKGAKAPDTYLFLPARNAFASVPGPVLARFGTLEHVMDLVLTPGRRLARLQATSLMQALLRDGCHIQLPPRDADETERAG